MGLHTSNIPAEKESTNISLKGTDTNKVKKERWEKVKNKHKVKKKNRKKRKKLCDRT